MSDPTSPPKAEWTPRIVAFFCNWCTYTAADLAGVSRMKYAANVRVIRLMCSGRVDPQFIVDALALGASCSKLDEMARAFTVFARLGQWWPRAAGHEKDWVYVRRIVDRTGATIEDNTVPEDPELAAGDRLDRVPQPAA